MRIPRKPPNIDEEEFLKDFAKYARREDIREFAIHANENYHYWDQVIYRPKPEDVSYEFLWTLIKYIRGFDAINIKISEIDGFSFNYSRTDLMLEKLHEFDMNLGGNISDKSLIPEDDRDKYLISSLMEEAIASSQLEGAATTREVAKDMLRKGRKPTTDSEKMILNNYLTIRRILEFRNRELTPELLLEIHESMTKDTLEKSEFEGRYRNSNDIVVSDKLTGTIFYTPPDYNLLPELIKDLCKFANDMPYKKFMHPIVKASFLHFLIGYIHPFIDGNGRTARAIFYWYLLHKGYSLIEYMTISKTIVQAPIKYAKAYLYTELDENDITYFLNYQIKSMEKSLNSLREYIKRQLKKNRTGDYNKLLQIHNINLRQAHLLREFIEEPDRTITISEVRNIFNVVYQTARTDLLGLRKMGYLDSMVGHKNKLQFSKSERFDDLLEKNGITNGR